MRIGIIGNGFVGRATQIFIKNYYRDDPNSTSSPRRSEILPMNVDMAAATTMTRTRTMTDEDAEIYPFYRHEHFNQINVYVYDIRPEACIPLGITLEDLDRECDLLFFCLPTPLDHDGRCYTRILEDVLSRCKNPFKVIRSTVPVGFSLEHKCYFMPEFLTEANWEIDFRETKEWIVGLPVSASVSVDTEEIHVFQERIQTLIRTSHRNGAIHSPTVVFCETNEAEMLKLMKNCFLSAKVSIMNEFYDFCAATHTDYETVAEMAKQDARMGISHFHVPGPDGQRGFGGTCFPKDTHSLYYQMNAHGLMPHIYQAILARNDTHDRPQREWSLDTWRTTIPLPTPASKVVVVFTDTKETTRGYLADVIRTNLSKKNIVIQVVRDNAIIVSHSKDTNLLTKHQKKKGMPLFFPRIDECYYTAYSGDTALDTMREVVNIIDLWNSHKEMILYAIKQSAIVYGDDGDGDGDDESGTEGFDSDEYDNDAYITTPAQIDYVKIFEEYFGSQLSIIPNQKRKLVVLF